MHNTLYREQVAPPRGGEAGRPITFRASRPGTAVIRGSDLHTGTWSCQGGAVYRTRLDDSIRAKRDNPFFIRAKRLTGRRCLGQLIVDGRLLVEVDDESTVRATPGSWARGDDLSSGELLVHFGDDLVPPEERVIEVTVRERCFAPHRDGLGHIRLIGLVFEHCGNQFPSGFWNEQETFDGGAPQAGAVGTRRGHHWTIRHCVIRHANAIGLDCGMEGRFGESALSREMIETVGYHIIESNEITDNGACGIAGAGQVGTRVVGNRIERNNTRGWTAPETAGMKFHFFYDGLIAGNLVRDNDASGIWLDNQWYGTRVTGNVCLNNLGSGTFIEMGDGACDVDHNVCAYTRCGEGIYLHDSSGVSITHNLLYANAHFGLHARIVTQRRVADETGGNVVVGCERLTVERNVFVDNYRGQTCLPPPEATRSGGNRVDQNLYLQGFQWQWQGSREARFGVSDNDGRVNSVNVDDTIVDLDRWRQRTGFDLNSISRSLRPGAVENGAVEKGGMHLSSQALRLDLRDPKVLDVPAFSSPPGPFIRPSVSHILWPVVVEESA